MDALFKNATLQRQFERDGFIIVPFLTGEEVAALKKIYDDNFANLPIKGLHPTHSRNGYDLSVKISDLISAVFKNPCDHLLHRYQFFLSHFMVKSNVDSREFELHQDWSIVQEEKYPVAQIWCPLVDTYPENGGMFVLPKSHRYFSNKRSGSLFRFHIAVSPLTEKHIIKLRLPAGHALLYHNRLIHGSFPNQSQHLRIVAMSNVSLQGTPYVYYQKNGNRLDMYQINRDVFMSNLNRFEKGGLPDNLQLVESFDYSDNAIEEADILEKVRKNTGARGIINRIFGDR